MYEFSFAVNCLHILRANLNVGCTWGNANHGEGGDGKTLMSPRVMQNINPTTP